MKNVVFVLTLIFFVAAICAVPLDKRNSYNGLVEKSSRDSLIRSKRSYHIMRVTIMCDNPCRRHPQTKKYMGSCINKPYPHLCNFCRYSFHCGQFSSYVA
ncbi:unnamed protein product [Clavelina lepadiformis]|uniref:Uncharacterized protein n=1 Tax=Clavelina lepadiformis TaxID=159417 RepID=A0ABP0F0H2_CLALP